MKKQIGIGLICICLLSCNNKNNDEKTSSESVDHSNNSLIKSDSGQKLSCKLTSPELQKRKETVLESLKQQILESQELSNGYAFKFEETDKTIVQLVEFIKGERDCCSFFTFELTFVGDEHEIWLSITGPEGAKEMVSDELGFN